MKRIHLAIVDDHEMFVKSLEYMLNTSPLIEVTHRSKNGAVFIRELKEQELKPNIVLMDIEMPLMNGYETTRETLKLLPECKILYMTGYNKPDFVEQAIKSKGHGFINKSSTFETLLDAILQVHLNGYYFNEHFTYTKLLQFLPEAPKFNVNMPESNDIKFSPRELQVIRLLYEEKTDSQIAELLGLSAYTAEKYRKGIMKKVNSKKTIGVVVYAIRKNLV